MCNDQLIIAYTFLMLLGAPQMHNEYFYHNEPHNDAPSVSVCGVCSVICQDHDLGCKGWAAATGGKLCESEEGTDK